MEIVVGAYSEGRLPKIDAFHPLLYPHHYALHNCIFDLNEIRRTVAVKSQFMEHAFYRLVIVNGPSWKAPLVEEYGDGVMSAIDFGMVMKRLPNPQSVRVKITMSGKFFPCKYYGASRSVPENEFEQN